MQHTLRILSWNIRHGGGSRTVGIINAVTKISAGIIVFNEFRNNSNGVQIRSALLRAGYLFQAVSGAPKNINSVLIASKYPFQSELYHDQIPDFPYAILGARFSAIHLLGLYLPHKKKHSLFPWIIQKSRLTDLPVVLAGDFNTGFNFVDQKGNSFWYQDEIKELLAEGFVDAFRYTHGDVQEYSWYSHQGNGFRYDHIWVQESIADLIGDCSYLHKSRDAGLSDHSPQMLTIEI